MASRFHKLRARQQEREPLTAQAALYLVAAVGTRLAGVGVASKLVRLTTLFAGMNLALLVGFFRWLTTEPEGVWSRTLRQ